MYELLPLGATVTLGIGSLVSFSFGESDSLVETSQCLQTIQSFADLPDNWDDAGGVTFKKETVANARALMEFMTSRAIPCPDVSPNPHGTIAMEWENDQGYAYVEVGASQLTALVKTVDRRLVFYLDRVNARTITFWSGLAFQLQSVLFPQLITRPMWISTSVTGLEKSSQSLAAPYAIATSD